MRDEFEESGVVAAGRKWREENIVPTAAEQERLKRARKKMRDVRTIDSEAEEICRDIFDRYPDWCRKLAEKERTQR